MRLLLLLRCLRGLPLRGHFLAVRGVGIFLSGRLLEPVSPVLVRLVPARFVPELLGDVAGSGDRDECR
jgi:hypothetical protein